MAWSTPKSFWTTRDTIMADHLNTLEENSRVDYTELQAHKASTVAHLQNRIVTIEYAGGSRYPTKVTETEAGNTNTFTFNWGDSTVTVQVAGVVGSYTITCSLSGNQIVTNLAKDLNWGTALNPVDPAWTTPKTNWTTTTTIGVADEQRIEQNQNFEVDGLTLHEKDYFAHSPSRSLSLGYQSDGFISQMTSGSYSVTPTYSNGRLAQLRTVAGSTTITETFSYNSVGQVTSIERRVN